MITFKIQRLLSNCKLFTKVLINYYRLFTIIILIVRAQILANYILLVNITVRSQNIRSVKHMTWHFMRKCSDFTNGAYKHELACEVKGAQWFQMNIVPPKIRTDGVHVMVGPCGFFFTPNNNGGTTCLPNTVGR